MHVLAISYLFPNNVTPNAGVFVLNRLKAANKHLKITVINPIPWFFFSRYLPRYRNFHQIPAREVIDGIEVFHPRFFIIPRYFKFLDSLTFFLAALPVVQRIQKRSPINLIDLHWTYPDLLSGYIFSRFLGKRLMVTIRGQEAFYDEKLTLRKLIVRALLPRADRVIALSEQLSAVAREMPVPDHKVEVIINGVDTSVFTRKDQASCRRKLNLPPEERIIISVGSLIHRKGFDRIIKSMPEVIRHDSRARLYIIGTEGPEGDYRTELYRLIDHHGLHERVTFVGAVKNADLADWYGAADAFCLASRGEGSPNVLMEALACGCPSVTTRVGSVDTILTEDFMGEVVPNDERSLAPPLLRILAGGFDRGTIADTIRKYDWDWCAQQVIRNYNELRK